MARRDLRDILGTGPIELAFDFFDKERITGSLYEYNGRLLFKTLSNEDISGRDYFFANVDNIGCAYISFGRTIKSFESTTTYRVNYVLYGDMRIGDFRPSDIKEIIIYYASFLPDKIRKGVIGGKINIGNGYCCEIYETINNEFDCFLNTKKTYLTLKCMRNDGGVVDVDDIRVISSRVDAVFSCIGNSIIRHSHIGVSGVFDDPEERFYLTYERGDINYMRDIVRVPSNNYSIIDQKLNYGVVLDHLLERDLAPVFVFNNCLIRERLKPIYLEDLLSALYKCIDYMASKDGSSDDERRRQYETFMSVLTDNLSSDEKNKYKNILDFLDKSAKNIYVKGSFDEKMHSVLDNIVLTDSNFTKEYYNDMCIYSNRQRNSIMHCGVLDHDFEQEFIKKYPKQEYITQLRRLVWRAVCDYIRKNKVGDLQHEK